MNKKGPQESNTRPLCKYGTACYRKNPAHFQEYRHPGIYVYTFKISLIYLSRNLKM